MGFWNIESKEGAQAILHESKRKNKKEKTDSEIAEALKAAALTERTKRARQSSLSKIKKNLGTEKIDITPQEKTSATDFFLGYF